MSAREVRSDIVSMLMTELESPTAKAQRKEAAFVDGGFMINDEEEE